MLFAELVRRHGVDSRVAEAARVSLAEVSEQWNAVDAIRNLTSLSVLDAFRKAKVASHNLHGSTGYGYDDPGRQAAEDVFAAYFGTESALVRPQLASGTHAIACCLFGVLRPGDELVSIAGKPYDTLEKVIGVRPGSTGSLAEHGVTYKQVPLGPDGRPDPDAIERALGPRTRMTLLQRSRGYDTRPSISVKQMSQLVDLVKSAAPDAVFFVDNCYGEFAEAYEPTHAGADLVAGSLIKNPGGGIAPAGGYIAGKARLVEAAAARLTAPGIGMAVGATLDMPRLILQGFFMGPSTVAEAMKGAIFVARLFERLGYAVSPRYDEPRADIVQSIEFGNPESLLAFCRGLQAASPVDSHVVPEPWKMPGYSDPVVMAGGTFISGSSIELGADGALRPPYAAYCQGGLSAASVVCAVTLAAGYMNRAGLLPGPHHNPFY